jgi:hypothetical protein
VTINLITVDINQLLAISCHEQLSSWNALSDYESANLNTLCNFLRSNAILIPKHIPNKPFKLFLDDAFTDLSDSVAFSPPASKSNIAIVDPIMINNHFYIHSMQRMLASSKSFNNRADSAYWRGSLTGQATFGPQVCRKEYISTLFSSLQRIKLCVLSHSEPRLMDFRITSVKQWLYSEAVEKELRDSQIFSEPEPFEHNLNYKYVIDIDGNSNSWPGFFMKLASGSCVFKINSDYNYYQWYYKYLSPWKHYVPINADMSDLKEKIAHIQKHSSLGAEIARNSSRFILSKSPLDWARLAIQDFSTSLEMAA